VHLRGTGESFAANIGGRMLGTPFMYVTQFLATMTGEKGDLSQLALMAGLVAFVLMATNFVLSCFLPEPSGEIDEQDGLQSPASAGVSISRLGASPGWTDIHETNRG